MREQAPHTTQLSRAHRCTESPLIGICDMVGGHMRAITWTARRHRGNDEKAAGCECTHGRCGCVLHTIARALHYAAEHVLRGVCEREMC